MKKGIETGIVDAASMIAEQIVGGVGGALGIDEETLHGTAPSTEIDHEQTTETTRSLTSNTIYDEKKVKKSVTMELDFPAGTSHRCTLFVRQYDKKLHFIAKLKGEGCTKNELRGTYGSVDVSEEKIKCVELNVDDASLVAAPRATSRAQRLHLTRWCMGATVLGFILNCF